MHKVNIYNFCLIFFFYCLPMKTFLAITQVGNIAVLSATFLGNYVTHICMLFFTCFCNKVLIGYKKKILIYFKGELLCSRVQHTCKGCKMLQISADHWTILWWYFQKLFLKEHFCWEKTLNHSRYLDISYLAFVVRYFPLRCGRHLLDFQHIYFTLISLLVITYQQHRV